MLERVFVYNLLYRDLGLLLIDDLLHSIPVIKNVQDI